MDLKQIALLGIGCNILGILMLFYFGMPFRLKLDGEEPLTISPKASLLWLERLYGILGTIGLLFALTGSGLQAVAVYLTP